MILSKIQAAVGGSVIVMLLAALAYVWISSGSTIKELRRDKAELTKQLDLCEDDRLRLQANQGRLEASIARQNSSIDAAKAEALRRASEAAEQRSRASEAAQRAKTLEQRLAARQPRQGQDACAAADELILESLQ